MIFCFQEHTSPPGADIFPVRESLKRLGLSDDYVLLAIRAQSPRGGLGKRRLRADPEAARMGEEDLSRQPPPQSTCMAKARAAMWLVNSLCCTPISSPPGSVTAGVGGPCPPKWISPSIW